jgi:hypothetical protein
VYWVLDLENEVHSIWVIRTSGLQECKGRAMVGGLGQGRSRPSSGFFGVARRPTSANACGGYLERPMKLLPFTTREVFGHIYIVGQDPNDFKSNRLH